MEESATDTPHQCEGTNYRGWPCTMMLQIPGKRFCKYHEPLKPKPPVRPSEKNKRPKKKGTARLLRRIKRNGKGNPIMWPKAMRGKNRLIDSDMVISSVEGISGIAHISVSYPGFDFRGATYEEMRARYLYWFALHKYAGMPVQAISDMYGKSGHTVWMGIKRVYLYIRDDRWYTRRDYQHMVQDIRFELGLLKAPRVRPGRPRDPGTVKKLGRPKKSE